MNVPPAGMVTLTPFSHVMSTPAPHGSRTGTPMLFARRGDVVVLRTVYASASGAPTNQPPLAYSENPDTLIKGGNDEHEAETPGWSTSRSSTAEDNTSGP